MMRSNLAHINRLWLQSGRAWCGLVFYTSLALLVSACEPRDISSNYAMELMPDTSNNFAFVDGAFSISTDARFLFGTNYNPIEHPVLEGQAIRYGFILDLQTLGKTTIRWSDTAESHVNRYGMLEESGCWADHVLYITTFTPRAIFVDADASQPQWSVVGNKPCQRIGLLTSTLIEVRHIPNGGVQLWHQGRNEQLAAYTPRLLGGTEVLVEDLQVDSSGRWLAYRITKPRGSFSGNSRAYLLDLNATAEGSQLLANAANHLRFAGSYLYAQVRQDSDTDGRWAISRWQLQEIN